MECRTIATIRECSRPTLRGFYRVKLAFTRGPDAEFWLSTKQIDRLDECFRRTPKGYTCKQVSVYGVFDGDRFVWSGVQSAQRNDLPYLRERFGVEIRPYSYEVADVVELDMSQPAEISPDLLDQ